MNGIGSWLFEASSYARYGVMSVSVRTADTPESSCRGGCLSLRAFFPATFVCVRFDSNGLNAPATDGIINEMKRLLCVRISKDLASLREFGTTRSMECCLHQFPGPNCWKNMDRPRAM